MGLAGRKQGVRGLVLSGAPENLHLFLGRLQPLGAPRFWAGDPLLHLQGQ